MSSITATLNEFDIDTMLPHSGILIWGIRGRGKTKLCKYILRHKIESLDIQPDCIKIIDPSQNSYDEFQTEKNEVSIYDEYDSNVVKNFIDINAKYQEENKSRILVLDNCFHSLDINPSIHWSALFCDYPQNKDSHIITSDHPVFVPLIMRKNIDYIFMFPNNNMCFKRKMYDNSNIHVVCSFEQFQELLMKCMEEHYRCLVFANLGRENPTLQDNVFFFKVEDCASYIVK